jgi:hypothetical protein
MFDNGNKSDKNRKFCLVNNQTQQNMGTTEQQKKEATATTQQKKKVT